MLEETVLGQQDIAFKNMKIKEYMNQLISKNNNQRCECCPYGYHVNLDFVEFAKDISNSHNELQKIRRYQRKLERAQNNLMNNRDGICESNKDSFIVKRSLAQELTCSSSDSNSADCNAPKLSDSNEKDLPMKSKKSQNDIIYIPSNPEDCTSRSSDESAIQSPSFQNDLNNSNSRNMFKGITLPEDNYRRGSSSSKSFVVSYEHLMSIREQMSASLKRVQDLEMEVKNSHELRQKVETLSQENQKLQNQLLEKSESNNTKTDFINKMIDEASEWQNPSDIPNDLLQNLERIFQTKPSQVDKEERSTVKLVNSRSTQTDVNGNLIIDTLSFLTYSTKDVHSQSTQESPPISSKVHRRNFGVTVRPTHHHFTQQISFSSKSFKPEESLSVFHNWIQISEDNIDKKIGLLLYNLLGSYFKNMYKNAIDLLKEELLTSPSNYKSWQSTPCQTVSKVMSDMSAQCTTFDHYSNKGVQAQPLQWNKYSNTRDYSLTDCSVETDRHMFNSAGSQTISGGVAHHGIQAELKVPSRDFICQVENVRKMIDISSITDQHLINDLISEQIEKAVSLIQEELTLERESRLQEQELSDAKRATQLENEKLSLVVNSASEYNDSSFHGVDEGHHHCIPTEDCGADHYPMVMSSSIVGSTSEVVNRNLVRSQINYLNFTDEMIKDCNNNMNQSPILEAINTTLNGDSDLRNESIFIEEIVSDKSDSVGSSPIEGCYYTTDNRIDYHCIDQINEEDEVIEEKEEGVEEGVEERINEIKINSDINVQKAAEIDSNAIKQTEDTPPSEQFPENVCAACNFVAIWMNDSTTTCSKDLNESFGVIRQFWFDLTRNNCTNLNFYTEKFKSFNATLLQRIINIMDLNGNTSLHYAVSEGRWSIVRQILETDLADLNKTNKAGYTVLMLTAVSEVLDEDTLKLLISKSHIDKQSVNDAQQTALMLAASQGKTLLVQLLLDAGASVNVTDSDGSSALMCACDNGHSEVVRLFLSRADIDTELEDKTGSNAMKIALENGHKDIALLIFAKNNLHKGSQRSKRRSGSSSHPTSPLSPRKFK